MLEAEVSGQRNVSTGTRSRAVNRVRVLAAQQGLTVPSETTEPRLPPRRGNEKTAAGFYETRIASGYFR